MTMTTPTCWCDAPATVINAATDATPEHFACDEHVKDGYRDIMSSDIAKLHASEQTYRLELSGLEVRALRDVAALLAPSEHVDALTSAADKLQWLVDFLDDPETFAAELRALRVER